MSGCSDAWMDPDPVGISISSQVYCSLTDCNKTTNWSSREPTKLQPQSCKLENLPTSKEETLGLSITTPNSLLENRKNTVLLVEAYS